MKPGTVVWINGSFGSGKSSVAEELLRRHPRSALFDPEFVGSMLRTVVPSDLQTDDYQDMPVWRDLVASTVAALARRTGRQVIVPMTLVVPDYFEAVVGGLRRDGIDVQHFTLVASRESVRERLRGRPDTTEWTWAQVERCVTALEHPRFARHIETDGRRLSDVVQEVESALSN